MSFSALKNALKSAFLDQRSKTTDPEAAIDDLSQKMATAIDNFVDDAGGGTDTVFWNDVQNKPSTFPPSAHGHAISDVTGLQGALDGKSATGHTHTTTEVTEGSNLYYTTARVDTWWTTIKTLASTFTGLLTLDNVLIKRVYFTPITASFAGTYTADLSLANIFILTMTGNGVLDFSNAQVGAYQWIITTSGHTLTLAVGKFQGEFDVAGKVLISGIYDGSKMVITSIKNLTDI
jgi:hypothetical protein